MLLPFSLLRFRFPRVFSHLPARPVINQRPPATPLARLTVRPLFPHPHFFLSQETLTFISPAPLHSSLLSSSDSLTTPRQKKDSHPNDRPCLRHPLRPKGVGTPLEPAAEARRRRSGGGDQSFFCHAPQFFFLSLFLAPCYHTPRSGGGLGEPVNLPICVNDKARVQDWKLAFISVSRGGRQKPYYAV